MSIRHQLCTFSTRILRSSRWLDQPGIQTYSDDEWEYGSSTGIEGNVRGAMRINLPLHTALGNAAQDFPGEHEEQDQNGYGGQDGDREGGVQNYPVQKRLPSDFP